MLTGQQPASRRAEVDQPDQTAQAGHLTGLLSQRFRIPSGGVGGCDDTAHAGAGKATDGNTLFLQHLQDADVRQAARTAAAQDQAYTWGRSIRCHGFLSVHSTWRWLVDLPPEPVPLKADFSWLS
jgi:hypothetical protein